MALYYFLMKIIMNSFLQTVSTSIKNKLFNKLSLIHESIKDDDLYINEDHKLLCFYYKKIADLKLQLKTKEKKLEFKYMKNIIDDSEFNTLISNEYNNNIEYKEINYKYNIKWNDYNKKFINKLNFIFNYEYIKLFFQQQYEFLKSLTTRELYNIKYYTYHGDIYLNAFLNGTFNIDLIKNYSGNLFDNDTYIYYFYYQFKDYFRINNNYKGTYININDNDFFCSFIKKECLNFNLDIYNYIFKLYLNEMKAIFKKAPKTTDNLILYRGVSEDYINKNLKNKYYKTSQFTSTSIFVEKAINYTNQKNRILLKININKGVPLIFVEGITLAENDFEVILPINSFLYLKYPCKEVFYYSKKDNLICPSEEPIIINLIEFTYI